MERVGLFLLVETLSLSSRHSLLYSTLCKKQRMSNVCLWCPKIPEELEGEKARKKCETNSYL